MERPPSNNPAVTPKSAIAARLLKAGPAGKSDVYEKSETFEAPDYAAYGLTLHETKTRYVDFRPRLGRGHDRDATFDFLGFNHVWTRSRKGNPVVRQFTARDRPARAVKSVHRWRKTHRHEPLATQHEHLARVIRGHCNYYGRIGNSARLSWFRFRVAHCWRWSLSRRSSKGFVNWDRMNVLLRHYAAEPARRTPPLELGSRAEARPSRIGRLPPRSFIAGITPPPNSA